LVDRSGDIATDGTVGGAFIAECVCNHMRIPGINMEQVDSFRRHAIENCIRGKFLASVPPRDDLIERGDVVHTQCCAVIVDVYEWLSKVIETASEMEELNFSDFSETVVLSCIREYYGRVLVPVPNAVDTASSKDHIESLFDQLRVVTHVHNRHMFSRTLNAVRDIFELRENAGDELAGFVTDCLWQTIRAIGLGIGSDLERLEEFVKRVGEVVQGWSFEESSESLSQNTSSFRARMVTAMTGFTIRGSSGKIPQQRLKELEMEETIQARRLMTPCADVRRGSVFTLMTIFLRTIHVSDGGRLVDEPRIQRLVDEWLPEDDSEVADMRHTIEVMMKDCGGSNSNN
jgi:hypothetical protein